MADISLPEEQTYYRVTALTHFTEVPLYRNRVSAEALPGVLAEFASRKQRVTKIEQVKVRVHVEDHTRLFLPGTVAASARDETARQASTDATAFGHP